MHALATELNETLQNTIVDALLSDVGQRMFFPKGIVAQSAEAGQKATRFNATIGMATSNGQPMHLSDIYNKFAENSFKPSDLFSYAPGGGDQQLRNLWKKQMLAKNPSLAGKSISLPIVTAGLTHGLSMLAQLFAQEGDTLVIPDLAWDNYELIFAHQVNANVPAWPARPRARRCGCRPTPPSPTDRASPHLPSRRRRHRARCHRAGSAAG